MTRLALRIGSTVGQAYTLVLSVLLLVITTGVGLPAVLNHDVSSETRSFAPFAVPPTSALGSARPDAPAAVGELAGPPDSAIPAGLVALTPLPGWGGLAPSRTTPIAGSRPTPTTSAASEPLRIFAAGWAAAGGGTAAGSVGVPENSLPVGTTAGFENHRSFLRLVGDEHVLRLAVIDGPATNSGAAVHVVACPITAAGWMAADNVTFAEAPAHDCSNAVMGSDGGEGLWTFDLRSLDADRPDGFALVAVTAPGATFRITFSRETAP